MSLHWMRVRQLAYFCAGLFCYTVLLCGIADACEALQGHRNNFRFAGPEVSGRLTILRECTLKTEGLRYNVGMASQWWGAVGTRGDLYLLSALELDQSLDGTQQLVAELEPNVPWKELQRLELRTVDGQVLAAIDLTASSSRRKLLQENCDSNCQLAFDGGNAAFCSCQTLYDQRDTLIVVYWNEVEGSGDEATMDMGFQATSDGWAGLGFTRDPDTMVGSNAVIVRADSSSDGGADAGQYYLGAQSVSGVVPANNLTISNLRAESDNGMLKALFTLGQNQVVTLSNGDQNLIWGVGSLSSDGGLEEHNNFGIDNIAIRAASTSTGEPAAAPTEPPVEAPEPSKADAPEPSKADAPEPSEAAAPEPSEAAAPEPSSPGGTTGTLSDCTLVSSNQQLTFGQCSAISNTPLRLFWMPPQDGAMELEGALEYQGSGWGSVAWPQTPGEMIGANAIIVKEDSDSPTGASVDGYFLASKSVSGVEPPAQFTLISSNASRSGDKLTAAFKVSGVPVSGVTPMIYGWGPTGANGNLQRHDERGAFAVNFNEGGDIAAQEGGFNYNLAKAHGWLMALSFGVLFPIGIGIARTMKVVDPVWFYLHVTCQLLGYTAGLAGWICGWVLGGTDSPYSLHRGLAIAVMVLFTLQLGNAVARPKHDSKFRRAWNVLHWWMGRIGLGLAIWNIYEGLINVYPGDTSGYVIAYSIVLGVIVGLFFAWELIMYVRLPPPASFNHEGPYRLPDEAAGRYTGSAMEEISLKPNDGQSQCQSTSDGV